MVIYNLQVFKFKVCFLLDFNFSKTLTVIKLWYIYTVIVNLNNNWKKVVKVVWKLFNYVLIFYVLKLGQKLNTIQLYKSILT